MTADVTGAAGRDRRLPARANAARSREAELTSDLERARRGDEAAFVQIFRAVQPGLLRYLTLLVGAADAEDVASDAWAAACRDLGKFRGDMDGFRAWVTTIGRRRAIDHLRAKGRRPADPYPVEELYEHAAREETDSLALESMSTEAAIAFIATLPRDQAEAVLLRAVLGLDAKSAGRVLGKRAGAVRVAAFRGLNNLLAQLERSGMAPGQPRSSLLGNSDARLSDDGVR